VIVRPVRHLAVLALAWTLLGVVGSPSSQAAAATSGWGFVQRSSATTYSYDSPSAPTTPRINVRIVAPTTEGASADGSWRSTVAKSPRFAAEAGEDVAFHYTRSEVAGLIEKNGLRPGSYVTQSGDLSPLQAQIDLALPRTAGSEEH
jgi:hypothetical protein